MSIEIERVVPRFVLRPQPTTHLLAWAGCVASITDLDAMLAQVDVHAGTADAGLQVATRESGWIVVAAGGTCMVETVTDSMRLAQGDALLLPPGTAALLLGEEWLALRLSSARLLRVQHFSGSWLARHAMRLADMLRAPDSPFAIAQRGRMATRLLRELEHVRRDTLAVDEASA